MAVRILCVLTVVAIFYGCGQSSSPPAQGAKEGSAEPKSVSPSSTGQQVTTQQQTTLQGEYTAIERPSSVHPQVAKDLQGKMVFVSRYCASASATVTASASASAGEHETEICVMKADGTSITGLANASDYQSVSSPVWSPDEKTIAFLANYHIWTMGANGSNLAQVTDTVEDRDDLAWSPDGKQIGFTKWGSKCLPAQGGCDYGSADPAPAEVPNIYVMNADGSDKRKLLEKAAAEPAWSPDGKEIVFSIPEDLMTQGTYSRHCDLYVMDADGSGTPRRLTDDPGCDSSPEWSPDGTKIAFTSADIYGDNGIYTMNADGTGITDLTNTTSDTYDHSPVWSPDGKKIAFVRTNNATGSTIYIMNVDGSDLIPVRKFPGNHGVVKSLDWR